MAWRYGLGPVFAYEWRTAARRWQMYAGRSLFVLLLLLSLAVVWATDQPYQRFTSLQNMAAIGANFFYAVTGTQLVLVLLAAPGFTAGSICLDKARGSMQHLLLTDLSNVEIVLGKLAAKLIPVVALVACALPVMFLCVLLGGIDPEALLGAFLVSLGLSLLGCTLALTLSIWASKTHDVLFMTYMIWTVLLLADPFWGFLSTMLKVAGPPWWFRMTNPFYLAFAPYQNPGASDFFETVTFLEVTVVISAILIALSVWRVRAVSLAQAGRPAKVRRSFLRLPALRWPSFLPGPSLDFNPVLWREWQRRRSSGWGRLVWLVYVLLAVGASSAAVWWCLTNPRMIRSELPVLVNAIQVPVGFLFLTIASVTVLFEERVRGSLDVLLTTPLPTAKIIWGKWWGAYRMVPLLLLFPAAVDLALMTWFNRVAGLILLVFQVLVYGAAITSMGLLFATRISRFGRAVTLSLVTYVVLTVGWFFLIVGIFHHNDDLGPFLATASPFFAVAVSTISFEESGFREERWLVYGLSWVLIYTGVTALLLVCIFQCFDRFLGRITLRRPPYVWAPDVSTPPAEVERSSNSSVSRTNESTTHSTAAVLDERRET